MTQGDRARPSERAGELRLRLLEALLFEPPIRRTELCERLDAPMPILMKEVARLVAAGVVDKSVEDRERRPLGALGRPPVYLSLVRTAAYAVGIEISGRALQAVVCDLAGDVIASRSVPWYPVNARVTMDRAHELVEEALGEAGIALHKLVGIGVSATQALALDQVAAGAFADWQDIDPAAEFEARFAVPATVERAAIAGAVAEQHFGAGIGVSDLIYVRLSASCGIGFIIRGTPHRGHSRVAGEVGHVPGTVGQRRCYCGQRGCLETVASPEAVAGLLGEAHGTPITVPRMLELVRGGDSRARRLVATAGALVGEALAPAISLINPAVCVVGGDLAVAGEPLLAAVRKGIARCVGPVAAASLEVTATRRGRETEPLGAALMQLRSAPEVLARRAVSDRR